MKKFILGALLVPMLTACGGVVEAPVEGTAAPVEAAPEEGEVNQLACSKYYYEFTYYSDCTRTTVVGWESLNCQGQRYLQGTKTRYYDADIADLCPAGCGTFPYSSTCN